MSGLSNMTISDDEGLKTLSESEVRHRLANLFQLLSTLTRMRIQRAADDETRRQLSWMLEAISALGALQQRLAEPAGADFALYLADMLPQWRRRCAGRPVQIELDAAPVIMREQLASALALIVNELVSNAISHAHPDGRPGTVLIALRRRDAESAASSGTTTSQIAANEPMPPVNQATTVTRPVSENAESACALSYRPVRDKK